MADLWRIKLGKGTANSGSGQWEYYEDRERMAADLLDFALEAAAGYESSAVPHRVGRLVRSWRKHKQGVEEEPRYRIQRVYNVDQMIDNEWVPVKWRLIPPSIQFEDDE